MKLAWLVAGLVAVAPAAAQPMQKWVDEKGRVYYGDKPKGISVKPAEIKGGGAGTASTEDLQKKKQDAIEQASAASGRKSDGKRFVGKAMEYKPDVPRGPAPESRGR